MHSSNLGQPEAEPREPQSSSKHNDQQSSDKMLDQALADTFPGSDVPSAVSGPEESGSPNRAADPSYRDLLTELPPGTWVALSIDNKQLLATGATRDEAERNARERGHPNVSLVEVGDDEPGLQEHSAA